jgi:hypothetical protein
VVDVVWIVVVVIWDLVGFGEGNEGRIKRALEICGDVGVWVEWMRGRSWEGGI